MKKHEEEIFDDLMDSQEKILETVGVLIEASWDSDTVKLKIESLMKERAILQKELYETDWDSKN